MAPRLLVAAAMLCASIFPVSAQQACRSVDADLAEFEGVGGFDHEFLQGPERERAVAVYNASPPQSDDRFEIVFIGRLPGGFGALALGNNGEICTRAILPPDEFAKFLRAVKGQAI
jgi:hypothetical protein